MFERLKYWVWLTSMDSMSPKKMNRLIEEFGDPVNLWYSSVKELKKINYLNETDLIQLIDKNKKENADRYLSELAKKNIRIITIKDGEYPDILRNIYDPPVVLYVKGGLKRDEKALAIVGSRNASEYGSKIAYKLAYKLSLAGFTVISGLAKGIDTFAHIGALEAGGRTVAILGCGIDRIYPQENRKLSEKIENSGAIISEYLPGNKPMPYNFPARNRIISGMAMGIIIVEAGEKSGSLITANHALDQGREVFAVPGNIDSINSKGTNKLIKDGARIITGIEDVLEEFGISDYTGSSNYNLYKGILFPPNLTVEEKAILKCLADGQLHIDLIAVRCGMDCARVSAMLALMEISGYVRQLPGKYFMLDEKLMM